MVTMRAIRIHEHGDAGVLRYEEAPRPTPGADEIVVRVIAAGVNPIDWKVRAGLMRAVAPLSFPWIPGSDFSGVVDSVGSRVTKVHAGDAVFGKCDPPNNGSYAEYVAVKHFDVAAKPRSLDHVHAAAVPLAALTAWQGLFGDPRGPGLALERGQTVLILGAAGGVGGFAVQLAKTRGARVVATARPGQEAYLRALGADTVVNTTSQSLADAGKVDAVLDLVGGDLQQLAWPQLKQDGAFASTMGKPSDAEAKVRSARTVAVVTKTNAAQLTDIAALIDDGKVEVRVSETIPLASARRAHELLERGGVHGKLVLAVG